MNFDECDQAVTAKALQYVVHKDACNILLNAVGLKYPHQSLVQCQRVLEMSLPLCIEKINNLLLFVNFEHVPIIQSNFKEFSKALLKYFEKEKDDKMINELQAVKKRVLTAPLDFVKAFYDISKLLESKVSDPLFPRIKALGINLLEYPRKTLLKALVQKLKNLEKAKLITQTRYSFHSVFEDLQQRIAPSWLKKNSIQFTQKTIWRIIMNQGNRREVKVLLKMLENCCPPEKISLDFITNFIANKLSTDSKEIQPVRHSFPSPLTEQQWKIVFYGLNMRNVQEKHLFRSILTFIEEAEEKYKELEKEEMVYLKLTNCPPNWSETKLQYEVKKHFIKFGQRSSNIAHVFKLHYEDVNIKDHAIVQFDDETSANYAFQILEMNPLQLGARRVNVYIP